MKFFLKKIIFSLLFAIAAALVTHAQLKRIQIKSWITTTSRDTLFQEQKPVVYFDKASQTKNLTIEVNERKTFQTMDGFGFALTGGSAMHLIKMSTQSRAALLKEVFLTDDNGIGVSYLRVSIGASDLNEKIFSYDDLPQGSTDTGMKKFNLGPDTADVIPVLKEIVNIAPWIKIMASPWSPPTWMKTNNDTRGGRLKPAYYAAYGNYFVKYIKAMQAEGIIIDAVTVQNEPLHAGNNPSLLLPAPDEADFIKNNLGPAFKAAGITAKIIIYDHNADRPDYPVSILNDSNAAKYIDGSAFHLYGGKIETLSQVHNEHPNKNIYFTEQMVVENPGEKPIDISWPVKNLLIGATRNWCRTVLLWNLAADAKNKPYTSRGGCNTCQGAITIEGNKFTKNAAYYVVAHLSKFVRPGSVRIASTSLYLLSNTAFKTPDGKKVLLVLNNSKNVQTFTIRYNNFMVKKTLNAGSAGTYVW